MKNKLQHIMLIDDNTIDNFFHTRAIKKYSPDVKVTEKRNVPDALQYLTSLTTEQFPDVIFLDIAMPRMSGWDFLDEYNLLYALQKTIVTILSGSDDPVDVACAEALNISYIKKPLKVSMLENFASGEGRLHTYAV